MSKNCATVYALRNMKHMYNGECNDHDNKNDHAPHINQHLLYKNGGCRSRAMELDCDVIVNVSNIDS